MPQQTIDTTASLVVPPATRLAAFELNVSATPLVITFDVEALNAAVDAILENYAGLEIEEGDIAAIKSEMAGLNKIKERIESACTDIPALLDHVEHQQRALEWTTEPPKEAGFYFAEQAMDDGSKKITPIEVFPQYHWRHTDWERRYGKLQCLLCLGGFGVGPRPDAGTGP